MSDAESVLGNPVEAFNTLEIPVAYLDGKQYILHHLRCTGPEKFREKGPRSDWVWVRRQAKSKTIFGELNGRLPGRLNALFKLCDPKRAIVYRLAHITLLECINDMTTSGEE